MACPTCGGMFANNTKFFDHIRRQSALDRKPWGQGGAGGALGWGVWVAGAACEARAGWAWNSLASVLADGSHRIPEFLHWKRSLRLSPATS